MVLFADDDNKDKWVKNDSGDHYSYEKSEFQIFQYNSTEGSLNSYTLSPGGAPDGYSYVADKTVASAGGLSVSDEKTEKEGTGGIKKLKLNGAASVTAWIAADASPVSFTISMSGELTKSGSGGGKVTWNAWAGTNFFWIEPFECVIPEGQSASFTAKENGSSKQSKWTIDGVAPKNNPLTSSIIFNRSWWDVAGWFDTGADTPKPGDYTIEATADGSNKKAQANLKIVAAEFKEHGSHSYGFDDYTNWSKNAADYYGSKTGECTLPYASVRSGYQGRSNFTLTPSPISRDIEFSSPTDRLVFSPATTKSTTGVVFNASSGWFSSSATLSAELNNTTFAQLGVSSFDQASKQILIVLVVPNASTTITAPAGTSSTTLNKVYQQVVLNINCSTDTFIYSAAPSVWASSDRSSLKNAFIASPPAGISISSFDHILFVIAGSDSGNALAWGEVGGKYMWIYTSTNYAYVVAHELGHNYGLGDQYTSNNGSTTMGDDKYNLMNAVSPAIHNNQFRLRRAQWTTIR